MRGPRAASLRLCGTSLFLSSVIALQDFYLGRDAFGAATQLTLPNGVCLPSKILSERSASGQMLPQIWTIENAKRKEELIVCFHALEPRVKRYAQTKRRLARRQYL